MRALLGVLLSLTLLSACADEPSDTDPAPERSTYTGGPEDTLPLLGAWVSKEPWPSTGRRVVLTLSDDNTYAATDECAELLGRWQLRGGRVELAPNDDGVACEDDGGEPIELPTEYVVEGDTLVSEGDGLDFTQR